MIRRIVACFSKIWLALPGLTTLEGLSYLGSATVTGLMPAMWKSLFDALYAANDVQSLGPVAWPMVLFVVLQSLEVVFRLMGRYVSRASGYSDKVVKLLEGELLGHAASIPYEKYEHVETYDGYRRSIEAVRNRAAATVVQGMYQLPAMVFAFVLTLFMLWTFNAWLPIVAIAAVLPTLWSTFKFEGAAYKLTRGQTSSVRKMEYYAALFTDPRAMRDAAIYECSDKFIDGWRTHHGQIKEEEIQFARKKTKWFLLSDVSTAVGYGIGIGLTILLGRAQSISIGTISAMISSIGALQSSLTILLQNTGSVQKGTMFFDDYQAFMQLPAAREGGQFNGIDQIELKNVSFAYPSSEENAISGVSLTLSKGETVALVGANGSGKTTLCKLIMGLYEPSSGEILYGGIPGAEIDPVKRYEAVSPVFQDFVQYHMTLRHNVALSDVSRMEADEDIQSTLSSAGLSFSPDSLDMLLGKEFGAKELSGGEWQKLAIARGKFKKSGVLFFDEPTSAIDPLAEVDIIKNILDQDDDRLTVIVTHRIGSATLVDRVLMMKDGRVIADGNHHALMHSCPEYQTMYESQAKWYE